MLFLNGFYQTSAIFPSFNFRALVHMAVKQGAVSKMAMDMSVNQLVIDDYKTMLRMISNLLCPLGF